MQKLADTQDHCWLIFRNHSSQNMLSPWSLHWMPWSLETPSVLPYSSALAQSKVRGPRPAGAIATGKGIASLPRESIKFLSKGALKGNVHHYPKLQSEETNPGFMAVHPAVLSKASKIEDTGSTVVLLFSHVLGSEFFPHFSQHCFVTAPAIFVYKWLPVYYFLWSIFSSRLGGHLTRQRSPSLRWELCPRTLLGSNI